MTGSLSFRGHAPDCKVEKWLYSSDGRLVGRLLLIGRLVDSSDGKF